MGCIGLDSGSMYLLGLVKFYFRFGVQNFLQHCWHESHQRYQLVVWKLLGVFPWTNICRNFTTKDIFLPQFSVVLLMMFLLLPSPDYADHVRVRYEFLGDVKPFALQVRDRWYKSCFTNRNIHLSA